MCSNGGPTKGQSIFFEEYKRATFICATFKVMGASHLMRATFSR